MNSSNYLDNFYARLHLDGFINKQIWNRNQIENKDRNKNIKNNEILLKAKNDDICKNYKNKCHDYLSGFDYETENIFNELLDDELTFDSCLINDSDFESGFMNSSAEQSNWEISGSKKMFLIYKNPYNNLLNRIHIKRKGKLDTRRKFRGSAIIRRLLKSYLREDERLHMNKKLNETIDLFRKSYNNYSDSCYLDIEPNNYYRADVFYDSNKQDYDIILEVVDELSKIYEIVEIHYVLPWKWKEENEEMFELPGYTSIYA